MPDEFRGGAGASLDDHLIDGGDAHDVLEVVERMRTLAVADVKLLLPGHSPIGRSTFNLKLLRSSARQLGKRLTIITADPVVRRMVEEAGLAVGGSVGAVNEWPGSTSGVDSQNDGDFPALPPPSSGEKGARIVRVGTGERPLEFGRNRGWHRRLVLYPVAVTVLGVGLIATGVYVPSARVTLVAEADPYSVAGAEVRSQVERSPIKVRTVAVARQGAQSFTATGVKVTPGLQATGIISYSNSCPDSLLIGSGQRLRAGNGVEFVQQGDQTVPPKDQVSGLAPGTASAPIIALASGVKANLAAGQLTEIESNSRPCLTATNVAATAGGSDDKKEPQISQGDLDLAKAQLADNLRGQVNAELGRQAVASERVSNQVVFQEPEFVADRSVGDTVASFSGSMVLRGVGSIYTVADVQRAMRDQLEKEVVDRHPDRVLVSNSVQADYSETTPANGNGQLSFRGAVKGYLAPRLDFGQIQRRIAGKSPAEARRYLQSLPVRSVAIDQSPLPLPMMPFLSSRIEIRYVVEQGSVPAVG